MIKQTKVSCRQCTFKFTLKKSKLMSGNIYYVDIVHDGVCANHSHNNISGAHHEKYHNLVVAMKEFDALYGDHAKCKKFLSNKLTEF